MKLRILLALILSASFTFAAEKPLKLLLIAGGCCHDYAAQKDILKAGIEARANATVDIIFTTDYEIGAKGTPDATRPKFPIYGNPDYAKGYDLVIHDECAASISVPGVIEGVLAPHRAGLPGVNLHCAMHSYRVGGASDPITDPADPHAFWFQYLGIQSSRHGPQEPIVIAYTDTAHAITTGLAGWTTIKEELYNNVAVLTAHALAKGTQTVKKKDGTSEDVESVVVWTNEYGPKKARVFSTTIGHNNDTVADARYLDLVTRGVLWACDKLDASGKAKAGYGPGGK
ncbi:MAG: ThuA domain-containing protein [Chthoniobacteraceae bacterium]